MPNREQINGFQGVGNKTPEAKKVPVPAYGVKQYLERASSFYYRQDNPKAEAGYLNLLQDINRKGENWRTDEYLVKRVEDFIQKRFGDLIKEKQAAGDKEAAQYHQERLKILLDDLHRKK